MKSYTLQYNLTSTELEFQGSPNITFTEFSTKDCHLKIFDSKIYLHYREKDGVHIRKVYNIIPKEGFIDIPYEVFYGTVEEKILEWIKQTVREYHKNKSINYYSKALI